ncbi:hypothetical protein COD93_27075 [Bacillus cereus]|nr:hypothetical protein COD93_27075 [Bacillus cereus]
MWCYPTSINLRYIFKQNAVFPYSFLLSFVDFYKYWTKRLTYFDTFSENSVWKGSAADDVVQYKETSSGTMWHTVFVIKETPDDPRIAQHSLGKFDTPIVLPVTSSYSVLKFSQS